MHVTERGNEKLGRQVHIVSRPVGLTCPPDCPFLKEDSPNRCYGEFTEIRFPQAKVAAKRNLKVKQEDIFNLLSRANDLDKEVRIHERGDFGIRGKLDVPYIRSWIQGIKKAIKEKVMPKTWGYTHIYSKLIASLQKLHNTSIYASVHNAGDVKKAKKAGFTLFAYVLNVYKQKGGSKNFPAYVNVPLLGKTLVCPEQRLGRNKITCDKCRWCIEGKGNVVFLEMHKKGA